MQGISFHLLLKQLPLKDIIRDYLEKEKKISKGFEKKKRNLINFYDKLFKSIMIK